ncbi:hypothetical protein [Agilicoccus flavus]|uniref:hypothetical protein n=1 Tax=Agilicoccus flavus TaxID=2775968 RepID=UPI001CF671C6|nr:hypothetical protein [Agilicoccus flavus]
MHTLIAYVCRDAGVDLAAARERVEARYAPRWAVPPRSESAGAPSCGLALWEAAESPSRWPAWSQAPGRAVASLYAPLGVERVVGAIPLPDAPLALAEALRSDPAAMLRIAPPFVLAHLHAEADALTLHTDALGVGRLFEVTTPWGRVWSNRPVAALRFAGLPATADPHGWAQSAVADEFFGETTPYAGVRAVDAASTIHWDGRAGRLSVSAVDIVASWSGAGATAAHRAELAHDAAQSLRAVAASVSRLYDVRPVVDLSGGRDSRLVAASFVAAGADVTLHSHDAVPGDLDGARTLVGLLADPPEHRVRHLPTGGRVETPPFAALERARAWHDVAEGLRPCTFLGHRPPATLDERTDVAVGGVGGEIAHGFFYPGGLDALLALPEDTRLRRFAAAVVTRQAPVPGATNAARAELVAHVLAVLRGIAARGHTGASVLDVYYLRERLRRWGTTAERLGTVSPLLSPAFIQAALAMTPQDRQANTLHRDIIRSLVPAWADVPFFPAESSAAPVTPAAGAPTPAAPPRVIRVADASDADRVEHLLADSASWGAAFDVPHVHDLWRASRAGETTARQERVLRSALWRGSFADHLAGVEGGSAPHRPARPLPASRAEISAAATAQADAARAATTSPSLVARLARTPAWRAVRDTPAGHVVRDAYRLARR